MSTGTANGNMVPSEQDSVMPIAIVGVGCRFPGEARSPQAFFEMLSQGRAAWSEVPKDRYSVDQYYHPFNNRAGTTNSKGAHFLAEDPGLFDAPFCNTTSNVSLAVLAANLFKFLLLPLKRQLSMHSSGYCLRSHYDAIQAHDIDDTPLYQAIGGGYAMLSSRLSHFYNLNGPSLTLDTACSSGLVALFDDRANGYARGEGICVMALKPLDDALRDGDTIRAVVRGSGINQDGKTPGITVPNPEAQASMIRTVYEKAGLDYTQTQYFEAHGTGTPVGDPLELSAVANTLGKATREAGQPLYVGSVKTNIGHLEGCAGLAGLLKTILCLENGVIVPSLNFEKPNPKLRLDEWGLKVPTKTIAWPVTGLRRASVNSFGYGGTNAHAIIDDAYHYLKQRGLTGNTATIASPISLDEDDDSGHGTMTNSPVSERSESPKYLPSELEKHPRLFVLSSPEQNSLQRMADALVSYVKEKAMGAPHAVDDMLSNLAFTLDNKRSTFQWRATFAASAVEDLTSALTQRVGSGRAGKPPKIAFVFTGQGAQWHAMGRELLVYEIYAQTLREADKYLKSLGADWSVWDELTALEEDSRINKPKFSQPLCAILQIALVRLLDHWGVTAGAVVGHSSGEIGALSAQDCWKIAYHRGRLSQAIKTIKPELDGAMMSVGLSEENTKKYLAKLAPSEVAIIACINSPSNVTVSGDALALDKLEGLLRLDDVFARRLKVENAYHSPHMEVIAEDYRSSIDDISALSPKSAPLMFSTVTGSQIAASELNASYWVRNMVSPVQFVQAVQAMVPEPAKGGGRRRRGGLSIDTLLEIGPHSALQGPLKQILAANGKAEETSYYSLLARNQDAANTSLGTIGALWTKGQQLDFLRVNSLDAKACSGVTLTDLPTYSWNHTHKFWHESDTMKTHRFRNIPRLDLVGKPVEDFNPLEPRWRNILRVYELPWLSQHQIQGAILYPAAGMLCAVLEAAQQLAEENKKLKGFEFRDIIIGHALVIPSNDEGISMELHMKPRKAGLKITDSSWWEFTIYSHPKGGEYVEHCSGLMQIQYEAKPSELEIIEEAIQEWKAYQQEYAECQSVCTDAIKPEDFYATWDARGLNYGPLFRPITNIHNTPGVGCCSLEIPDTKSVMPHEYEYDHLLHPTTLDAVFQTFFSAITDSTQGLVPTSIDSVFISADLPKGPGAKFRGFTKVARVGFRHYAGPLVMSDESWNQPKIVVKGFLGTELGASSSESDSLQDSSVNIRKLCSTLLWKEDVDHLTQKDAEIVLHSSQKDAATSKDAITNYEKAARIYMVEALSRLDPATEATMAPHLVHFVQWMRRRVELTNSGSTDFGTAAAATLLRETITKSIDGRLLSAIGTSLGSILNGSLSSESVLMNGDMFSEYRTDSVGLQKANHAMMKWLDLQAHKRPDLNYLEVGAGKGSISLPVLEILGRKTTPRFGQYTFTDSDPSHFEDAQKLLKAWQDRIQYKKLDIDQDPSDQGFEKDSFDVIIAGNTLHETRNIAKTLSHCHWLLKEGGKLIFTEFTESSDRIGLIMGIRPSWWLAEDGRVGQPMVNETEWKRHLASEFSGLDIVVHDTDDLRSHCASFMVTTKPSVPKKLPFAHVVVLNSTDRSAESCMLSDNVVSKLKKLGLEVENTTLKEAATPDANDQPLVSGKAIVSLLEVERPLIAEVSKEDFGYVKKVLRSCRGGLWVSHAGVQVDSSSDPAFCATHGLLRTTRTEKPDSPVFQLDLSTKAQLSSSHIADLIIRSFKSENEAESPFVESEICEHHGRLYIARLYDEKPMNHALHVRGRQPPPEPQSFVQPGRPLRLSIGAPGLLDTLHFIDDERPLAILGENDVEIEVRANGVNFMDVMVSMGLVPDKVLGLDAAGIIKRTGTGVTSLKPGDRVATFFVGAYANLIHTHENLVNKIPEHMSLEEGASIPTVYGTAYQSLIEIGRLSRGETILIHSAAGGKYSFTIGSRISGTDQITGLGQAAIQLSKHVGADIFVTVSNVEKRRLIVDEYQIPEDHIFNSRDMTFAKGILRMTKGRGVDVVLNSLAGEALRKTWECIAMFGRFIEVGKKDILANSGLEMMPFLRNVTFASVNLEHMYRHNPSMMARVLRDSFELVRRGTVGLIKPTTVYKYSEMEKAFRLMQQGKHLGKLVLKVDPEDRVPVVPRNPHPLTLDTNATYVLVGGLGGIGRALAEYLAKNGAKHIAFISRSGDTKPEAKKTLAELKNLGVHPVAFACDITDYDSLKAVVQQISSEYPPIKGLVQGAMVLNDIYFEEMEYEPWAATAQPKIQGSWNLHNLMPKDLDFFVMLASISGIVGNGSQSNYAAGNTFQDGLAHWRRAQGLAASSLDLTMMAGVGWVAENVEIAEEYKADFMRLAMGPEELFRIFESAITGYQESEHRMPPQLITGAITGGIGQQMEHLKTGSSFEDAKWMYLARLDVQGVSADSAESAAEVRGQLTVVTSLAQAGELVEAALAAKLGKSLNMAAEDLDTAKPVHSFGVDSLMAIEVRNWIFKELKSQVSVFDILSAIPMHQLALKIAEKSSLVPQEVVKAGI
ncbi:MAG: hypothetical protein Q9157_002549 [Trypethelium eluteriae]